MHLALIDWCIIVFYLVGCMAAGLWLRRYIRGVEDFAVAGRSMDLNLGIASLAATELGLVTIMYTAQVGFTNGFAGATIGLIMAAAMYLKVTNGFDLSRRSTNRTKDENLSAAPTGSNARGSKLEPALSIRSLETDPGTPEITTTLP